MLVVTDSVTTAGIELGDVVTTTGIEVLGMVALVGMTGVVVAFCTFEQTLSNEPIRSASVTLLGAQHRLHSGPLTRRVGQKHVQSEHDKSARVTGLHWLVQVAGTGGGGGAHST